MHVLRFALAAIALVGTSAAAQTPKTSDGRPDLTGAWSNASLTPLVRASGEGPLVVTEEEARRIASGYSVGGITEEGYKDNYSDPNAGPPPKGADDFGVQAYDSYWWDPGVKLAHVKGQWRTSNIVDPADGQLPIRDAEALAAQRRLNWERYQLGAADYDGPEVPTLGERCIVFTTRAGPGMLSSAYNNNYRFVQTPDHMMILVEQAHDARIIPIFDSAEAARASHNPSVIKPWLGDTVGWWEGETFVTEIANLHPLQTENQQAFPLSNKAVITERFTRLDEDEIFYEFIVNDPETYTKPWKAEMSFYPSSDLYEYACHEGNYGMTGILAGARQKDRQEAQVDKRRRKRAANESAAPEGNLPAGKQLASN